MRPRWLTLTVVRWTIGIFFSLSFSVAAAGANPDQWTDEGGLERAKTEIAHCLERAVGLPERTPREDCIHVAFVVCEDEHGTSQRDLNECSRFSRDAWEARLAAAKSRILAAKPYDPRLGPSADLIKQVVESQARWEEWNRADCEIQAAFSKGGSIYPLVLNTCRSDRAAQRALELESMIDWELRDVVPPR